MEIITNKPTSSPVIISTFPTNSPTSFIFSDELSNTPPNIYIAIGGIIIGIIVVLIGSVIYYKRVIYLLRMQYYRRGQTYELTEHETELMAEIDTPGNLMDD